MCSRSLWANRPGERQKAVLRPFLVLEMIVATGALHAGAQKHLRHVGGRLQRGGVIFVADVLDRELRAQHVLGLGALAARHRRIEQLGHHHVEGAILLEARQQPIAIVAARQNAALRRNVLAGQRVFPKWRPMGGIVALAGEQLIDQLLALGLVGRRSQKAVRLGRRGNHADHVQIDAAQERGVVAQLRAGSARGLAPAGDNELVDRIERRPIDRGRGGRRRQRSPAAFRAARSTVARCRQQLARSPRANRPTDSSARADTRDDNRKQGGRDKRERLDPRHRRKNLKPETVRAASSGCCTKGR